MHRRHGPKGDYPYHIENGMFSQNAYRTNSDIQAFQGEINIVNRFSDSSTLQTKVWGYQSERGLPGSIIFFNDISVQRLEDKNFFVQSRYLKKLSKTTTTAWLRPNTARCLRNILTPIS